MNRAVRLIYRCASRSGFGCTRKWEIRLLIMNFQMRNPLKTPIRPCRLHTIRTRLFHTICYFVVQFYVEIEWDGAKKKNVCMIQWQFMVFEFDLTIWNRYNHSAMEFPRLNCSNGKFPLLICVIDRIEAILLFRGGQFKRHYQFANDIT